MSKLFHAIAIAEKGAVTLLKRARMRTGLVTLGRLRGDSFPFSHGIDAKISDLACVMD